MCRKHLEYYTLKYNLYFFETQSYYVAQDGPDRPSSAFQACGQFHKRVSNLKGVYTAYLFIYYKTNAANLGASPRRQILRLSIVLTNDSKGSKWWKLQKQKLRGTSARFTFIRMGKEVGTARIHCKELRNIKQTTRVQSCHQILRSNSARWEHGIHMDSVRHSGRLTLASDLCTRVRSPNLSIGDRQCP